MKKKLMTLQQHRLLKEAGQLIAFSERLKHAQKETTGRNREEREEKCRRSAKAANAVTALSGNIEEFLTSRYDFRYNLLTDETEFRPAGQRSAAFTPVGKRELNTFCIETHAEGIPCWDKDLSRYVYSTYIPAYHPFQLYMDELPDWDGKDRLRLPAASLLGLTGCGDSIPGCWDLPRNGWACLDCMPTAWLPFSSAASRDDGNPAFVVP